MENNVASLKKWLASPITTHQGSLAEVIRHLPRFERRTFGPSLLNLDSCPPDFYSPSGTRTGFNRFYDVIVRLPVASNEVTVPVGIVSPTYTLIQHHEIVDEVLLAVENEKVSPADVRAELALTEYGERMRLRLIFPDRMGFEVSKGDRMGLNLECYNSVDGSMRFMTVIGWLRQVCSNGLVMGVADTYYRRHNQFMELKEIAAVLHAGIASTEKEREVYLSWMKKKVTNEKLAQWVNKELAGKWGIKAATRTWHITTTGHDVTLADPFEKATPTQKSIVVGDKVEGAVLPGNNVYAVSQALSWLAKERRDVQEQLARKQEIPVLIKPLLGKLAA